tara:strand:- start:68 stop:2389 length:2322 start_codon:yes stop_codon:yes gene_type:complete
MESKLIDIPNKELDEIINQNIEQSEKVLIVVSFIFEKGLGLILDKLKKFHNPSNITIITSNYLKSTEPKALKKLLDLKSLGSKIYLFDSLSSRENFHIKSYYFENEKNNFFSCIIGSSNMSFSAFKLSHELNIEIRDKKISSQYKEKMSNFLSNPHLLDLTEQVIHEYEKVYDENKNFMLKSEDEGSNDITIIPFKKPNLVQVEALEILKKARNELGQSRGLVVMATGLGKTILAALDVAEFKPKKILFVAHREEILIQSKNAFKNFIPNKKYGFYKGKNKDTENEYIFASIQTLGKKSQLENFERDNFDYIIVDEFHHVGAKSYKNLVEYFKPKFFLGLTATPNRTDNIDILQFCDGNLLYRKDLIDGVNLKLLSNFDYRGIIDKYVDYTKITWKGKKFDEIDLDKNLNTSKRANYIFENWSKHKLTRTLGFCASIKHCNYMRDFFLSKGVRAVSVHSKSETNRSEAIKMLTEKKIDILFSVDLFNEGVDIPVVDTIMMLRPTESKIVFIQQFGRGLRKAAGKTVVKVIDFIGNHKSFLEKPAALFNFDLDAITMGKFIENYKNNKLNLPDESRVFYDLETIDFFTKYSLNMKKENFIQYDEGNVGEKIELQVHKGFMKEDVKKLFKYDERGFKWNNMSGHIRPKNENNEFSKEQFLFITLIKTDFQIEYAYEDYFKNEKILHWQSVKGTKENNAAGQAIIHHKKNNSNIHLFVRASSRANINFLYCGKVNFLDGKGDGPFNANFELENPLMGNIKEELLRVSKLIGKEIEN